MIAVWREARQTLGRFVPGTGQDPGAPAVCTRPNARSSSPKSGVIPAQKSDGRPPGGPFVPGPRYNIVSNADPIMGRWSFPYIGSARRRVARMGPARSLISVRQTPDAAEESSPRPIRAHHRRLSAMGYFLPARQYSLNTTGRGEEREISSTDG